MITARSIKTGKVFKGKLATLMQRIGVAKPLDDFAGLNAADVVLLIKDCKTIDELNLYANDKRKTVKVAFEKKLKELS